MILRTYQTERNLTTVGDEDFAQGLRLEARLRGCEALLLDASHAVLPLSWLPVILEGCNGAIIGLASLRWCERSFVVCGWCQGMELVVVQSYT